MAYHVFIMGALAMPLILTIWASLFSFFWRPYIKARKLKEQGVRGPKGSFWFGNKDEIDRMKKEASGMTLEISSHDYLKKIYPHYLKWTCQYGGTFIYFIGQQVNLFVSDPELIKEILSNKFGFYIKDYANPGIIALLGKGLVLSEGEQWARHRRVVNPAFTLDKLKAMTGAMVDCVHTMLKKWSGKQEIEVNLQFQELTADIISHTAFGSSYSAGNEVFLAQKELEMLILESFNKFKIPLKEYLPTKSNKHRWKVERKLRETLTTIIEKRLISKETGYGNDLLGLMMEACMNGKEGESILSMEEIIDECKTFFFAGHETSSHLLTWAVFLLSTNPLWQERLRAEVFSEFGNEIPDSNKISKLKSMTMVLLEALRLYSPISLLSRTANNDLKLGSLMVSKGQVIIIPIAFVHHSRDVWGPDADEFNPLRFENGVSKAANHSNAMMAFSIGPRACVGQNFALLEAKIVLSMILQRFSFNLSPGYKHMPANFLTLQPQNGLQIVLKNLEP